MESLSDLSDTSVSKIKEIVEEEISFPDRVNDIVESNIRELMDVDLSGVSQQLEERIDKFDELTEKIVEKRRSIVAQLREEKSMRDKLNKKVQRSAKKVRELIGERENVNELIDEKHEELDNIEEQIKTKQEKLEKFREDLKGFSIQQKKKIESKLERVNWNLQTRSLPENIEERLTKLSMSLEKKLKKYRDKEKKFRKVKQLKRELDELQQEKKATKSAIAAYYQEAEDLTNKIHEFAKKRNEKKDEADKHHQKFIQHAKQTDKLNELLSQIKETKIRLIQTLRKIRSLKSEKRDIKERDRLETVMKDKVQSIKKNLNERGSIDFEDLSFLLEHGFLSNEIMEKFSEMGETKKREEILKNIEDQLS